MSLSLLGLCPPDSSDSELELSTVRHQPEGLDQLQALTKFTKKELQSLYRGFKNVSAPVSPVPIRASREILAHLPVSYPGNGVFAGLVWNGRAIWGVGLSMDIVKATVPFCDSLQCWTRRDSVGMKGTASATASTLPSACPTKGFPSPGLRGAQCASGSGHLILPEGGERSALWSQAWSQKWPRPLRGVTSPCRSVPRAWWTKTPSNSSTHSSSRREVSPNPGPPRLLASPDHVPFLGKGSGDHSHLPSHPFLFGGPDAALTYQRGAPTGHELRAGLCETGTDFQITQLQSGPFSPQTPPPTHISSSTPSMRTGTGPSTSR